MSTVPVKPHTRWPVAIGAGVAGALVLAIVVLAFLWPTKTSEAQNLPVGISGPAAQVSALEAALEKASPGTVDFVSADDRADAVSQIKDRTTYGAVVLGMPPEVLTAPAGSTAATQLLTAVSVQLQTQLAQQIAAAGGDASTAKVTVTPVVPLSSNDATGAGLAAASFPLALGGMLGGALITFLVVGVIRRLAALVGFGAAAGLILSLILNTWFEFLPGNFWLIALAMGATVLATSAFIVGMTSLLGSRGIAVGAVVTILIGNPISAAATPWQFLAQPWGAIGQFLVPGAGNRLIRTIAYFPDSSTAPQWLILSGWIVLGLILALAGHYRSTATVRVAPSTLEQPHRDAVSA